MTTINTPFGAPVFAGEFKLKMALLGPEESYKTAFRERVSAGSLSTRNKEIIGVTISGMKYSNLQLTPKMNANVYISLWDLDCSSRFTMFRTCYYRGSEAILIFLDENTLDQAELYYREVLRHNTSITIGFVALHDEETLPEIKAAFQAPPYRHFEVKRAHRVQDPIDWIVEKFQAKLDKGTREDHFALFYLPKSLLLSELNFRPCYAEYSCPVDNFDELNPHQRLDLDALSLVVAKLGFPIRGELAVVENRFGQFYVSLRDGSVSVMPTQCRTCKKDCAKREFICIVASTKGFCSNPTISQAELLVISKILALKDEDLPEPVLNQIHRLKGCSSFPK